jgi:hypothetical protein
VVGDSTTGVKLLDTCSGLSASNFACLLNRGLSMAGLALLGLTGVRSMTSSSSIGVGVEASHSATGFLGGTGARKFRLKTLLATVFARATLGPRDTPGLLADGASDGECAGVERVEDEKSGVSPRRP